VGGVWVVRIWRIPGFFLVDWNGRADSGAVGHGPTLHAGMGGWAARTGGDGEAVGHGPTRLGLKVFMQRHACKISGILSGRNRAGFRGNVRMLADVAGMGAAFPTGVVRGGGSWSLPCSAGR
jgi:hypothetical protein